MKKYLVFVDRHGENKKNASVYYVLYSLGQKVFYVEQAIGTSNFV
jgi:hypothetical protein